MSDVVRPAHPDLARRSARQKVAPFARYKGTSAWRKDRRRVREYAAYLAAVAKANAAASRPA